MSIQDQYCSYNDENKIAFSWHLTTSFLSSFVVFTALFFFFYSLLSLFPFFLIHLIFLDPNQATNGGGQKSTSPKWEGRGGEGGGGGGGGGEKKDCPPLQILH